MGFGVYDHKAPGPRFFVGWGLSNLDFWHVLAAAVALVFIIEGMLPFISPNRWRNLLKVANEMDDRVIRNVGLGSMLLGVVLLYLVH